MAKLTAADCEAFRLYVEAMKRAEYQRDHPDHWDGVLASSWQVSAKARRKYVAIDIGSSGAYLIDRDTRQIWGIKGYGKKHDGYNYGTLQTPEHWPSASSYANGGQAVPLSKLTQAQRDRMLVLPNGVNDPLSLPAEPELDAEEEAAAAQSRKEAAARKKYGIFSDLDAPWYCSGCGKQTEKKDLTDVGGGRWSCTPCVDGEPRTALEIYRTCVEEIAAGICCECCEPGNASCDVGTAKDAIRAAKELK